MRGEDYRAYKHAGLFVRITPACAGKTCAEMRISEATSDHPRMRGEDVLIAFDPGRHNGSPPHARGRRGQDFVPGGRAGITPACAGKTAVRDRRSVDW